MTDCEKATKKERERILSIIGEAYILNSKVAQNIKNRDDFFVGCEAMKAFLKQEIKDEAVKTKIEEGK